MLYPKLDLAQLTQIANMLFVCVSLVELGGGENVQYVVCTVEHACQNGWDDKHKRIKSGEKKEGTWLYCKCHLKMFHLKTVDLVKFDGFFWVFLGKTFTPAQDAFEAFLPGNFFWAKKSQKSLENLSFFSENFSCPVSKQIESFYKNFFKIPQIGLKWQLKIKSPSFLCIFYFPLFVPCRFISNSRFIFHSICIL